MQAWFWDGGRTMELLIGIVALAAVIYWATRKAPPAAAAPAGESARQQAASKAKAASYEPKIAEPAAPRGRKPYVATGVTEQDQEDFGDGPPVRLPLSLFIEYTDAAGNASSRRISIRNLRYSKDRIAINAYCHERREPRCFISDRINMAADCETGEILADPAGWFMTAYRAHPDGQQYLQRRQVDTAAATERQAYQDALLVLAYVARADGRMTQVERAVIVEASRRMQAGNARLTQIAPLTDAQVQRMRCDHSEFLRAVRVLKSSPPGVKAAVLAAAEQVMKADGSEDAGEAKALAWLRRSLG